MTTLPSPQPRPRRWPWVVVIVVGLFLGTAAGALNALTLTRDAAVLRDALVSDGEVRPRLLVQGTAGAFVCGLARLAVPHVTEVPPEARVALAALRGASVAVYRWDQAPTAARQASGVAEAVATMGARGWNRTVAVRHGDDTVVVFTRLQPGAQLRVCVAVSSGTQLVVTEARLAEAKLEELLTLVAAQTPDWDYL